LIQVVYIQISSGSGTEGLEGQRTRIAEDKDRGSKEQSTRKMRTELVYKLNVGQTNRARLRRIPYMLYSICIFVLNKLQ
jgi:hypothetical protein